MNDIDYNAVIEIINNFLNNEKVEIYGISVGEEFQLRTAIENLLKERQADKDRIKKLQKQANELVDDYEEQLLEKNNYIFQLENEREALHKLIDEEMG